MNIVEIVDSKCSNDSQPVHTPEGVYTQTYSSGTVNNYYVHFSNKILVLEDSSVREYSIGLSNISAFVGHFYLWQRPSHKYFRGTHLPRLAHRVGIQLSDVEYWDLI